RDQAGTEQQARPPGEVEPPPPVPRATPEPVVRRRQVRRPLATKLSCRVVTAWTALATPAAHPSAMSSFSNPWPTSATEPPISANSHFSRHQSLARIRPDRVHPRSRTAGQRSPQPSTVTARARWAGARGDAPTDPEGEAVSGPDSPARRATNVMSEPSSGQRG